MINLNNHIVARCSWNTSFDDQERSYELQNEISIWSEHFMPRILTSVFNTTCSEYHSLKIKTLSVDLGIINYENLQEELSIKLKTQLQEQLRDILINPNKYQKDVEILKGEDAWFRVLEYYLLKGIMPWHFSEKKENINQLFTNQLQENREGVIQVIRSLGIKELVRKRIAWQFKEANIQQIIKDIEKSNHHYIIEFTEEFTKFQKQEALVKTGIHDFKRNLWFWILNYLFAERGSMFNKVEFVRSNIQQMANHFNMEYHELFELIEKSIVKLHEQTYIQSEFIQIIQLLSQKKQHSFKNKYLTKKAQERHWLLLEKYLTSSKEHKTTAEKEQFKELIQGLSKLDSSRFQHLIKSVTTNVKNWEIISNDVQADVFEILLKALSVEATEKIFKELSYLKKAGLQKQYQLDENWMLAISLQFIKTHYKETFTSEKFLNYFLTKVSKLKRKQKVEILENILSTSIIKKSIESNRTFKKLKDIYTEEVLHKDSKFTEEKLEIVLKELKRTPTYNSATLIIENYYEILRNWIKEQPKLLWNALKKHKDKTFILKIAPIVFNTTALKQLLLEQVLSKQLKFIKDLAVSIDKVLTENKEGSKVLQDFKETLFFQGIKWLIFEENSSTIVLVENLYNQLAIQQNLDTTRAIKESLAEVLIYFQAEHREFTEQQRKTLSVFIQTFSVTTRLTFLIKFIKSTPNKQEEVAKILYELVHTKKIHTTEFQQVQYKISEYLLKHSYNIFKECIQEFKKVNNTAIEITKEVTEIYWQCLADYATYKGDKTRFKKRIEKAIQYLLKGKSTGFENEKIQIPTGSIPLKKSILLLKKALLERKKETLINGKKVAISQLFFTTLENNPKAIRRILKEGNNTKRHLEFIQTLISFQQFTALIAKDKQGKILEELCRSVAILYDLLSEITGKTISKEQEKIFWKYLVTILRKQTVTPLKKITQFVLDEYYKTKQANIGFIINNSIENKRTVPTILKEILVDMNSIFRLIKTEDLYKNVSKVLQEYDKKGVIKKIGKALLVSQKIPSWFLHEKACSNAELQYQLLKEFPLTVLSILREHTSVIDQFIVNINFTDLVSVLIKLYPEKKTQLKLIEKLHKTVENISIERNTIVKIQQIIHKKIVVSWVYANWKLITIESIWKELLWEVTTRNMITKNNFFKTFNSIKIQLPSPLQISYETFLEKQERKVGEANVKRIKKTQNNTAFSKEILSEGVSVYNAGMVLLDSYYGMLFSRLELVKNNQFVSMEAKMNAIHYLQYVVTGQTATEESLLALNKMICGIPLDEPIIGSIEMSSSEKELIDGMISSSISHWPAIGDCSVNGFRGNWLVREGILREEEDRWNLTIEKRSYDILLERSPFSFSIIRYPWMPKPLHVIWPF